MVEVYQLYNYTLIRQIIRKEIKVNYEGQIMISKQKEEDESRRRERDEQRKGEGERNLLLKGMINIYYVFHKTLYVITKYNYKLCVGGRY